MTRLVRALYYLLLVFVRWQEAVMRRNAKEEVYDKIVEAGARHKSARDTADGKSVRPDDPDLFRD
jgi:hypothetical protein